MDHLSFDARRVLDTAEGRLGLETPADAGEEPVFREDGNGICEEYSNVEEATEAEKQHGGGAAGQRGRVGRGTR